MRARLGSLVDSNLSVPTCLIVDKAIVYGFLSMSFMPLFGYLGFGWLHETGNRGGHGSYVGLRDFAELWRDRFHVCRLVLLQEFVDLELLTACSILLIQY